MRVKDTRSKKVGGTYVLLFARRRTAQQSQNTRGTNSTAVQTTASFGAAVKTRSNCYEWTDQSISPIEKRRPPSASIGFLRPLASRPQPSTGPGRVHRASRPSTGPGSVSLSGDSTRRVRCSGRWVLRAAAACLGAKSRAQRIG